MCKAAQVRIEYLSGNPTQHTIMVTAALVVSGSFNGFIHEASLRHTWDFTDLQPTIWS